MQQTPRAAQAPAAPRDAQPARDAQQKPQKVASTQSGAEARLDALQDRRGELNNQIEALTRRRRELSEQRVHMSAEGGREHDARIKLIDDRSALLERELFQVNDQISRTVGSTVADESQSEGDRGDAVAGTTEQRDDFLREVRRAASNGGEDGAIGALAGTGTFLLFAFVIWTGFRRWIWKRKPAPVVADQSVQIAQLQRSIDVVAVEVERISEAQRYVARLLNDRALGAGEAQPVPLANRSAHPLNAEPFDRR